MQKAAINAGFSCPNIDGTKGTGGCIYCSEGSRYFSSNSNLSITDQINSEVSRIRKKNTNCGIIAYFQSNTNTYAPLDVLKEKYSEALNHPDISGISIATRPDCLSKDIIKYLSELNQITELTVELGLQTIHDDSAAVINRGYNFKDFEIAYNHLKTSNIRTCVHIINGIPGETHAMMLETAKILGHMQPDALKIHLMHVIKDTKLDSMYKKGNYIPMSLKEYTKIVVLQLEYITPETVIERLTGDGDKKSLVAPDWSKDKIKVLGTIDKLQVEMNSFQGILT